MYVVVATITPQGARPEALAAHGTGEPFTELSRQLEGKLVGAPLQGPAASLRAVEGSGPF